MRLGASANSDRPLRFVAFGTSIQSDWENPVATSARFILRALHRLGHEVIFLEQRSNPSVTGLLKARGATGLRSFNERFPEIQHRTYDLSRGWERTVWFGREAATADVILVLPGTPSVFLPEIEALPKPHPVRFVDETLREHVAAVVLTRATEATAIDSVAFGPAVAKHDSAVARTSELIVVAYDDGHAAESTAARFATEQPTLVRAGTANLPGWLYVPEVELPGWYARHRRAVVAEPITTSWSFVRKLLPVASGCLLADDGIQSIAFTRAFDADEQAATLATRARNILALS